MYVVKGVVIGTSVFFLFSLFYLYQRVYAPFPKAPAGTAMSIGVFYGVTIQRPLYLVAFVLTIVTACVCVKLLQRT